MCPHPSTLSPQDSVAVLEEYLAKPTEEYLGRPELMQATVDGKKCVLPRIEGKVTIAQDGIGKTNCHVGLG